MRVVVGGATGLIGRALAASLAADRCEVIALTRDPAKAEARIGGAAAGVTVAAWDARTVGAWSGLIERADAIVNLTGESLTGGRWNPSKKRALLDSRVSSIEAILQALRSAREPPRTFVQASAVGYYGARGDEPLGEDADPGRGVLAEIASRCEERAARATELGVRVVCIRTGVVLDARDGALPRLALPYRFGVGGYPGSGAQWVSWIHLDDEVRAIRYLLDHAELSGSFNLTAPEPAPMKELCRAIGRVLHRPTLVSVPAFALRGMFGEMADEALLSGQRVVPDRLARSGFDFRYPALSSALGALLA